MNVKARGATRRMSGLVRLLAGRNALRRPVDRIEGAVLAALSAAFLVAVAVASILSAHTYQSQRVASVGVRPTVAVLIQAGPFYSSVAYLGQAGARWRDPGGDEQFGVLTTATTPGIIGAAAGARIPVWLDRSGQPVAPPGDQVAMIVNALAVGAAVASALPWNGGQVDTLDSPHRSLVHPVVDYVRHAQQAGRQVAVLIPEIQPRRWRYRSLQNQRGLLLATVLRASTDVVICTIPYRLTTR